MIIDNRHQISENENPPMSSQENTYKRALQNSDNQIKNEEKPIQNSGNKADTSKFIRILLIVLGGATTIGLAIALPIILIKRENNNNSGKDGTTIEINENNYIKPDIYENFVIPPDKKIQIVGANFPQKDNIVITGQNNKAFPINSNGQIENVEQEDLPIYISFKESIENATGLFSGVNIFRKVDLSTFDSSNLVDASNMFENSAIEEIDFGSENSNSRLLEENGGKKKKFVTSKIKSASGMFRNCGNLKKVKLSPSFNVGKSAKGMFQGCSKLEELNTSEIISTEVEEMENMFENCGLKHISFSNDFLTGEVRSLNNAFKGTNLISLDISYLRLFSLVNCENILEGASITGSLTIGKYFSDDSTRDNLLTQIARVTDSHTHVFAPIGTSVNVLFEQIYLNVNHVGISVTLIDINYVINYRENSSYKLYSSFLHVGLGWDYDSNNTYDLDSSVLTFDSNLVNLDKVNFQQLSIYNGTINLNGDDVTGEGDGDDEEINVTLNKLPSDVQIFTVQINSYNSNSLKDVKSAYIKLSADGEVIGTYSINEAGDNLGLLIGCFIKDSNAWFFRPLNKIIPGYIVTESVTSIQEILSDIFK